MSFFSLADSTPKQEVKACFQCKGADACRPESLSGTEIRTSAVLGASNLYCYTVGKAMRMFFLDMDVCFLEIRS